MGRNKNKWTWFRPGFEPERNFASPTQNSSKFYPNMQSWMKPPLQPIEQ